MPYEAAFLLMICYDSVLYDTICSLRQSALWYSDTKCSKTVYSITLYDIVFYDVSYSMMLCACVCSVMVYSVRHQVL